MLATGAAIKPAGSQLASPTKAPYPSPIRVKRF